MARFSNKSLAALYTCDDRLITLFNSVIKSYDCTIIEGHRSLEKQLQYYRTGKSQTMKSLHLRDPSYAVDVAPYPIDWENLIRFYHFGGFVQATAEMLNIPIRWGGDWDNDRDLNDHRFLDLVHYELRSKVEV